METTPQPELVTRASVDKLQECLRSELSAVETYGLAIETPPLTSLHRTLQDILMSHARRTARLRERLLRLGAEPVMSASAWSAFVDALEMGTHLPDGRAAIAALEDGESRGLDLYEDSVEACDLWTRTLIAADFLPEQQRTHNLCGSLQKYIDAPS